MIDLTPSLCFSCFYSTHLRCPHSKDKRKIIKGSQVVSGYVRECPKYFPDTLTAAQVSQIAKVSRHSLRDYPWYYVDERLKAKGWIIIPVKEDDDNPRSKICYAVEKFPKGATV